MKRNRAVALYSGGLDSTLAILILLRQDIEVKAITFMNHFGCEVSDRSSCSKNPFAAAEKFGFEVKMSHLSGKFVDIVKSPKFGHGKNMNPCVDCRILMLREAKEFMEMSGAGFIVTGEVLGQRPMSQRRDSLNIIDREAGLKGFVLRPLSAKLLKPTIPEEQGIVKRDLLYDFGGRSRKPQMALAEELGLIEYPAPAGGCLLTEPNYAYRLRELLNHSPNPSFLDLQLLRIGRHFRISPECKVIVGRDHSENEALIKLSDGKSPLMRVLGHGSPLAMLRGRTDEQAILTAAALCGRYSDGRGLKEVDVMVGGGISEGFTIRVVPAADCDIEEFKIEKKARTGARSLQRT